MSRVTDKNVSLGDKHIKLKVWHKQLLSILEVEENAVISKVQCSNALGEPT